MEVAAGAQKHISGLGEAAEQWRDAYLYGALQPTAHEYDVLAHALNERFVELGGNHPIPYSDD